MRLPRARLMTRLQILCERTRSVYHNDRATDRAGQLEPLFEEAIGICRLLNESHSAYTKGLPLAEWERLQAAEPPVEGKE